jgi:alpha-beta hydrolase superfamily lysophospholipase
MMLCGSTEAADDCSVADVLVNSWVRMARSHSSGLPTTKAIRRELEFKTDDVALKGYSYSPPSQESETAAKHFILLLQGSASSAAQLAETASGLALAAKREVFVYEYRGYASESTVHPTAAAIQRDIDAIIDSLSERGRRGVVIGLSMGGIFAIQSLKRSKSGDLRALVDSAPAQVPTIPFLLRCPRWMNPLDAATADVVQRLGVLYGADDGWSKDPAAKELMEKVKAGGGQVWMIEGGHVDLSLSGLAVRLPIYVDFVQGRSP